MTRADQITPKDANEAAVLGFYTNLMKKDLDGFKDIWAEDAAQIMPFYKGIPGLQPAWRGKDTLLAYYLASIPKRRDHVFWVDALHRTTNPDVIVAEVRANSIVGDTGRRYDQQYVFVFHLRDGRIVQNREHFNPLVFRNTFPEFSAPDVPVEPEPEAPRADELTAKTPNEQLVLTFYQSLMAKDFDTWGGLFNADAKQENPFMPGKDGLAPGFEGRDRIVFHYRTVLENRRDLVFRIHAIHQSTDPNLIIAEVGGTSVVPETGRIYDQRYVWFFHLKDGRIQRMQEYFNPLAFESAFEGFLVGEGAVEN